MKERIRVGIVGCGSIAEKKHIPAILCNSELAQIVALCDFDIRRAEHLAKSFSLDVNIYDHYDKLFADKTVDVVHVLTPNATHCAITVAALRAGKHVMCEKPMALTAKEGEEMCAAQKASGKKLSVSYQNRFRDDSMAIHQAQEAGRLGDVYFAKAHATRRKTVPTHGAFLSSNAQGGGALIDIGTHSIDLALWLSNHYDIESVTAATFQGLKDCPEGNMLGHWNPSDFEVEDSAFGFVRMKSGGVLFIEAAWALNISNPLEACVTLCGTKGGAEQIAGDFGPMSHSWRYNTVWNDRLITVSPDDPTKFVCGANERVEEVLNFAPKREMAHWLKCIRDNTEPLTTPEQALAVVKIIEGMYTSANTGKTVYFD